jgi:polyhydroxyalkanoate synthesis regulator phasin
MAERGSERGPLETLTLAGLGGLAALAQRVDELADEIGRRLGVERDEVRAAISDVLESWRREASRLGDSTGATATRITEELGVASRTALDELELRVAQVEHRLKLLERGQGGAATKAPDDAG